MGHPLSFTCGRCGRDFPPDSAAEGCVCGGPLLAGYDFPTLRGRWKKENLAGAPANMWRYAPALPLEPDQAVTLGEGWTPLLRTARLGAKIGVPNLWVKDEGQNPTGSFEARGQACAISMAKKSGFHKLAIASTGNAAGALSAYAAAAGLEARIFMPRDVPQANFCECKSAGAVVTLVDGLIGDCAKIISEGASGEGWFDMSVFKEPYRVEGEKTMGYEIVEQLAWQRPDAILCPCGEGVGLIAIWRALSELEQLGWIGAKRPKMIAVQAQGCQPIVRAFEQHARESAFWPGAHTVASGLRVPQSGAASLVLQILYESQGTAVPVSDSDMIDAGLQLARLEGIFPAPAGGACVAAAHKLLQSGFLSPKDEIVILNTGSGLKDPGVFSTRFPRLGSGEQDKLGGLITPR
ncbi:MAG: threonine synthase [Bryobacteraceae bacterium]